MWWLGWWHQKSVDECGGVWCHGGFVAVGEGEPVMVLVLYYIEFVWAHATKTLTRKCVRRRLNLWRGKVCHQPRNFIWHANALRTRIKHPCCHLLPRHGFFTACLWGAATTPATTAWGPPPQPMQEGWLWPHLGHANHHTTIASFP